ncbi:MAG: hypothetical protein ACREJB_13670 [Planctomycetaceae bacterium]
MRFTQVVILVLLFVVPQALAQAPAPVEGDVEAFERIQAAQKTNLTLYPRGSFRVKVRRTIGADQDTQSEATMVWSGDKTFCDLKATIKDRNARGEPVAVHQEGQLIRAPGVLVSYDPSPGMLRIWTDARGGYHYELDVRPDEAWFHYRGSTWDRLLDTESFGPDKYRTTVRREDGGRVVLEREHKESGAAMRIVFSLAKDGNVIAYEARPGKDGKGRDAAGKYEWKKHPSGLWYVARHEYRVPRDAVAGKQGAVYTMEITEFDPDPVIAPGRFEISSLNVPQGTPAEQRVGRSRTVKNRFTWGEGRSIERLRLDELAEELRSNGTAAPDR